MNALDALRARFPTLTLPTPDQIASMTPDALTAAARALENAQRELDVDVAKATSRKEAADRALAETRQRMVDQFGVSTPEELKAQLDAQAVELADVYKKAEALEV